MKNTKKQKAIDPKDFDMSVKPTDDFYQYANGNWLKKTKIPPTENSWGPFTILAHSNRMKLKEILNQLIKSKNIKNYSDNQKIRDLYISAMDVRRLNKEGMEPLKKSLDRITDMQKKDDLISVVAYLHQIGVGVLWNIYDDQDEKNSNKVILRIQQGGIGMPDRDYYVKRDVDSRRVKEGYKKHILSILKLAGKSKVETKSSLKTILLMETRLAKASMTHVEQRDVFAMYNKKKINELKKLSPHIDWKEYFLCIKAPRLQSVIVNQPLYIKEVNKLLNTVSLPKWKQYLTWHLINDYASKLSDDFVNESFRFYGTVLTGTKELKPRWRRALMVVDSGLGDTLGKLYIEKYFPPSSKKKVLRMAKNLKVAYKERIEELDWMSAETKKKALKKLEAIVIKIGYPRKWKSYKKLNINKEVSFTENCMNLSFFSLEVMLKKLVKPTDRAEWGMTPPTVNAYYSPNLNEITFPAGILQPPFFNPQVDDAINYGGIGSTIGHELTHGFDDQGSEFDHRGNLKKWWTKTDKNKFIKKTKKLVTQYNNFEAIDGMYVNGRLTLGENIADLGGLVISYRAFKKSLGKKEGENIDGLTPKQRFFFGYSLADKNLMRDEFLKLVVRNDPHSPGKFRVNGPLSNMKEFYEAFDVKEGDKMYRKESGRVVIW